MVIDILCVSQTMYVQPDGPGLYSEWSVRPRLVVDELGRMRTSNPKAGPRGNAEKASRIKILNAKAEIVLKWGSYIRRLRAAATKSSNSRHGDCLLLRDSQAQINSSVCNLLERSNSEPVCHKSLYFLSPLLLDHSTS